MEMTVTQLERRAQESGVEQAQLRLALEPNNSHKAHDAMALKVNGRYVEVASAHRCLRKIPCCRPIVSRKRKPAPDADGEHPADQKIKMQFEAAGLLDMMKPEKPYHALAKNLYRHHVVVETGDNIHATVFYMSEEWVSQDEFTNDFISALLGRAGLNTARLPKRLQKEIRLEVLRIAATDPKLLAPLRAGCFFVLGSRPWRSLREEDGANVAKMKAEAEEKLRAELSRQKLKVIRARAKEYGVPGADLEAAMDEDEPEKAVIEMICQQPGIFDYDAMGDDLSADQMQCLKQARKELLELEGDPEQAKSKQLQKGESVEQESTEAGRETVIQIIIEAAGATSGKDKAALKSQLMGMNLTQLQARARESGVEQAQLELALGPWGEKHHAKLVKRYKMLIRLGFDEQYFLNGAFVDKDPVMIVEGQDEETHMFEEHVDEADIIPGFESGIDRMLPRLGRFVDMQAASVGTPRAGSVPDDHTEHAGCAGAENNS